MGNPKIKNQESFARQLFGRIKLKGLHHVELDSLSDGSCQYISITHDGKELCIAFDGKGETITDITLNKQIVKVVDYENVWKV